MRAAYYERQGPPHDVIRIGDVPTPAAGPGEVRVRLHASAVNPSDCNRRAGMRYAMEAARVVPNSDGAGVVDQAGEGVPTDWIGRRVWLYNGQRGGRVMGTAAEWIALPLDLVTALPDDVGFEAGACLGIPAMTAHRAVFADGPVDGKTVLVTGGAGAVGHYAVQLAAWAGARVIATASSEAKAAHARAAGASLVIDYKREDVAAKVIEFTQGAKGGPGVDRIVEVDFGGNLAVSLKVLKLNGAIAAYASNGAREPAVPFYEFMRNNVTVRSILLNSCPHAARRQAQADISRWLAAGKAMHAIAVRFPLDRTADAHALVEAGGKIGSVIVQP
ncbi:MAG TPA: NADPH:quinone reductase [Candidatus Cybelea sp.]|nr:NADPH:quinone reductase [Candidatus Cybelea sp.]